MRRKQLRLISTLLLSLPLFVIYSRYRHIDDLLMSEVEIRMTERKIRVSDTCQRYNIRPGASSAIFSAVHHPPAPQFSVFYFDPKRRWAYCPIYKAASTSMLHWLLRERGVKKPDPKKQISDVARQHYPSVDYPEAEKLLQEAKRWMVVRHPFERLLSAYRDKLENSTAGFEHGTMHFYKKYGRKIVAKYRQSDSISAQVEPTFDEFARYLADTDLSLYADDHWIPYYLFCTPCLVDYDLTIHFETFEQDIRLLMQVLRDKNQIESNEGTDQVIKWKHKTIGGRSIELINSYFRQLKKSTVRKLYEKYRLDFELFGYGDASDFIEMARED